MTVVLYANNDHSDQLIYPKEDKPKVQSCLLNLKGDVTWHMDTIRMMTGWRDEVHVCVHGLNLLHDGTGQLNEPKDCLGQYYVACPQSHRVKPLSLSTFNPHTTHPSKSCLFRLHAKMRGTITNKQAARFKYLQTVRRERI